jgi:hypothetical protein
MQSKNDTTETKTEKRAKKTRTNKDSALLHFMFIRDEITSLPRPRQGNRNKKLDDDQVAPNVGKAKPTSPKTCHQELAEEREQNDRLLDRLDEYERAIQKIDWITLHALRTLGNVQVGGRKPNLEIKELARAIAKQYLQEGKKLPTWKELDYKVRHALFKKDPQGFIERVKNGLDLREVLRNSIDPNWSYWRNVEGLVSERTWSAILTEIREEIKEVQQK